MSHALKTSLVLGLISLFCTLEAQSNTVTRTLRWKGDAGYSAVIHFSYDDTYPIIDPYIGYPDSMSLKFMDFHFYDPLKNLLPDGGNSVVLEGSNLNYPYLAFTYDSGSRSLVNGSRFDVGWDAGTGIWLAGLITPDHQLSLVSNTLYEEGEEFRLLDKGTYSLPEQASTLSGLALALCLLGLLGRARRHTS